MFKITFIYLCFKHCSFIKIWHKNLLLKKTLNKYILTNITLLLRRSKWQKYELHYWLHVILVRRANTQRTQKGNSLWNIWHFFEILWQRQVWSWPTSLVALFMWHNFFFWQRRITLIVHLWWMFNCARCDEVTAIHLFIRQWFVSCSFILYVFWSYSVSTIKLIILIVHNGYFCNWR